MITLEDDRLSFTFPEIARQLRAHVERQIPSCPSSCLVTRLSAKLRFVRQSVETARGPAAALDEAGASRTRCVSKQELGHEDDEIEAALRTAALPAIPSACRQITVGKSVAAGLSIPHACCRPT